MLPRYQAVQHLVKLLGPKPSGCACWVETYLKKSNKPILDSCILHSSSRNALNFIIDAEANLFNPHSHTLCHHNLIEPGYDAKPIWQSSLAVQPQRFAANLVFPKQVSEKETRGVPAKRVKIVQRLCNKNLATSCWHHTSGCFCHAQLFVRDLVRCAAILRQQKPYIHLRSSYSKIDCLPQAASIYARCQTPVFSDQVTLFMLSWRITNTNSSHNRSHEGCPANLVFLLAMKAVLTCHRSSKRLAGARLLREQNSKGSFWKWK